MGFFEKLLKNEAKKIVSDLVENVIDDAIGGNIFGSHEDSDLEYNESSGKESGGGERGLRTRLEAILRNEYGDYELRREIPATEIGADSKAKKYSYGLYKDGIPKAFIMIMKHRNHYRAQEVVLAREAACERDIPYMNFMSHMPNETNYISNRLAENVLS